MAAKIATLCIGVRQKRECSSFTLSPELIPLCRFRCAGDAIVPGYRAPGKPAILQTIQPDKARSSMIRKPTRSGIPVIALVLSGCISASATDPVTIGTNKDLSVQSGSAETCHETETIPARIETVTSQVLVRAAEISADGTVKTPPIYQSQSRQAIIRERKETTFEIPCENIMTPEFIATLQRALKARGFYKRPVTGKMDAATRKAVAGYQATLNFPSGVLSSVAARQLGLIAYSRSQILADGI